MRRDRRASVLTTLVFTDIVSSTAIAEEMGDRRWQELLSRHYQIIRRTLREHDGKERDTAGDGVFSTFDSPASAVRWACAAVDALRELGIWIRVGIHIGEAEVLQGKLSGINVHAAARTMALAGAGQILVTGSVRDIVRGSGFGFESRGVHELRGLEGEWHLFEVTTVDGTPRAAPPSAEEARARRDAIQPPPLVKRRSTRLVGDRCRNRRSRGRRRVGARVHDGRQVVRTVADGLRGHSIPTAATIAALTRPSMTGSRTRRPRGASASARASPTRRTNRRPSRTSRRS